MLVLLLALAQAAPLRKEPNIMAEIRDFVFPDVAEPKKPSTGDQTRSPVASTWYHLVSPNSRKRLRTMSSGVIGVAPSRTS